MRVQESSGDGIPSIACFFDGPPPLEVGLKTHALLVVLGATIKLVRLMEGDQRSESARKAT